MPHRRPRKRGSFGGHFDEIVEQFPEHHAKPAKRPDVKPPTDSADVHKRLFERAWNEERRHER